MSDEPSGRQALRPVAFAWRLAAVTAPIALLVSVFILSEIYELEVAIVRSVVIAIIVSAIVFAIALSAALVVNARARGARR
jgi:hypothetical protein